MEKGRFARAEGQRKTAEACNFSIAQPVPLGARQHVFEVLSWRCWAPVEKNLPERSAFFPVTHTLAASWWRGPR